MKDLIDRQALLAEYDRLHVGKPGRARKMIEDTPSVQPEKRTEERTETHACDLISRQEAIDEIGEWIKAFLENGHKESAADARLIQDGIIQLPSAQPVDKDINVPTNDYISRQAAIDALAENMPSTYTPDGSHPADDGIFMVQEVYADCIQTLKELPSAQPEIIYCRNCKKHNVNAGYKKDCCPLFDYRGISYGHEHDYQYCVYGVKKDERLD